MKELSKAWWIAAGKRALHTMAQVACGFVTVGACISDINWGMMASVSFVAGVASIFKSLAVGIPEVSGDTGSGTDA